MKTAYVCVLSNVAHSKALPGTQEHPSLSFLLKRLGLRKRDPDHSRLRIPRVGVASPPAAVLGHLIGVKLGVIGLVNHVACSNGLVCVRFLLSGNDQSATYRTECFATSVIQCCCYCRAGIRREEGAVKRLRGRGCFTVAAATAPALLGQV